MHVITEGMLAAFNAVNGYDDFHKGIVSFLQEKRWNEQEKLLVACRKMKTTTTPWICTHWALWSLRNIP